MKTSARAIPISPSSCSRSLPAWPDERQAELVLGGAGRLADEHQVGVGVAGAEDHRLAGRGELRAPRAPAGLLEEGLQLVSAGLCTGHDT